MRDVQGEPADWPGDGDAPLRKGRFGWKEAPAAAFRSGLTLAEPGDGVGAADTVLRVLRAADPAWRRGAPRDAPTCWVAGGALRDGVVGVAPQDVDVFVVDPEAAQAVVTGLLTDPDLGASVTLRTPHVARLETRLGRVDVVSGSSYASALKVVARFDFTACAAAVDAWGRVTYHERFAADARARRLVVSALPTPVASFWRCLRFKARGWSMAPEEYRSLFMEGVEQPESDGWLSEDAPAKGMPEWALLAASALRNTSDKHKLFAVLRRAAEDPRWAVQLESVALLAGTPPAERRQEGKWTVGEINSAMKYEACVNEAVRDFICAMVEAERA